MAPRVSAFTNCCGPIHSRAPTSSTARTAHWAIDWTAGPEKERADGASAEAAGAVIAGSNGSSVALRWTEAGGPSGPPGFDCAEVCGVPSAAGAVVDLLVEDPITLATGLGHVGLVQRDDLLARVADGIELDGAQHGVELRRGVGRRGSDGLAGDVALGGGVGD